MSRKKYTNEPEAYIYWPGGLLNMTKTIFNTSKNSLGDILKSKFSSGLSEEEQAGLAKVGKELSGGIDTLRSAIAGPGPKASDVYAAMGVPSDMYKLGGIMGFAGTITNELANDIKQAKGVDMSAYQDMAKRVENNQINVASSADLLNAATDRTHLKHLDMKTVTGKSLGQRFAGGVLSAGKSFLNGFTSAPFAYGGPMGFGNFSNGVTFIGNGGTHENNPHEGVPMGIAPDGKPNLVEEGEAIYNDYVFSNRLKVPKAVRQKYKLRGPKNLTFAEAFVNAQKEAEERPNDPISKDGLEHVAMILARTQEAVKGYTKAKGMKDDDPHKALLGKVLVGAGMAAANIGTQIAGAINSQKNLDNLNNAIDVANARQDRALEDASLNLTKDKLGNFYANYAAFGGPMFGMPFVGGALEYDMMKDDLMNKALSAQGKANGTASSFNLPNTFATGGYKYDGEEGPVYDWDSFLTNRLIKRDAFKNSRTAGNLPFNKALTRDQVRQHTENQDWYKAFTKYVYDNWDNPQVQKYLQQLDTLTGNKNIGKGRDYFKRMREDGKLGYYHATPSNMMENALGEVLVTAESPILEGTDEGNYDGIVPNPEEQRRLYEASQAQKALENAAPATPADVVNPNTQVSETPTTPPSTENDDEILEGADEGNYDGIVPDPEEQKKKYEKIVAERAAAERGKGIFGNWNLSDLRYAEPLANLGAVASDMMGLTNTPTHFDYIPQYQAIGFNPLGNYIAPYSMDTRYAMNQNAAQAAATRNAIMQSTAPSRNAGLLAADYNAQISNGDLYYKARLQDFANELQRQQFNRGTDQYNSEGNLKTDMFNAENRLRYANAALQQAQMNDHAETMASMARAQNLGNLAESVANIGREYDAKNWRDMLIRSGVFGTLSEKPHDWSDDRWKDYQTYIGKYHTTAKGGKIRKKKSKKGLTY